MTLFLDSADIEDAQRAAALGFVCGVTTNPSLLARTRRPPEAVIADLVDVLPGIVFYQPTGTTVAEREAQARRMVDLWPRRVGLKIPCTSENLALAARLATEDMVVGITAVFDPAQIYLACQAGARYVLPYVNRSTRLQGDGPGLVSRMRAVIDAGETPVEIVAASVKTPAEAVETVLAGAHHLTLPLSVIEAMGGHPLSDQAIEAFARDWSERG